MTDRSIRKQDELMKALQERTNVLEDEKRELQDLNDQLQVENYSLRRMASARDMGEFDNIPLNCSTMVVVKIGTVAV